MDQNLKQNIETLGCIVQTGERLEVVFDNCLFNDEFIQNIVPLLMKIKVPYNLVFSNCKELHNFRIHQLQSVDLDDIIISIREDDDSSLNSVADISQDESERTSTTDSVKCNKIVKITINKCDIKKIPSAFQIFSRVQNFHFVEQDDSGNLETIKGIAMMKKIKKLEICGHRFDSIPNEISSLGHTLCLLKLNNNMIQSFPRALGSLDQLVHLDLSYNRINYIDMSIGNLRNLKELFLQHNMIKIIPEELSVLSNLQKLDVSHNELIRFVKSVRMFQNLVSLHLEYNAELAELPVDMEILSSLEDFHYHNTKIMDSPSGITNMLGDESDVFQEQLLDFSNKAFDHERLKEHLFAIRGTINQLPIEYEVDLSHNQIQMLPDNFGVLLKDVGSLHLSYNTQFMSFAGQLLHLARLKWLYLDGIPISDQSIQQLTQFVENSSTLAYLIGLDISGVSLELKIDFVNAVAKNQAKNVNGIKRINGMTGTATFPLALRVLDKIGTLDDSRYQKLIDAYDRALYARTIHRKAADRNAKCNTILNIITVFVSFAATVVSFAIKDQLVNGILSTCSTLFISISTTLELSKRYANHKYAAKVYDNLATSIDFQISYPTKDVQEFAHEIEKAMIEINNDTEYFPKEINHLMPGKRNKEKEKRGGGKKNKRGRRGNRQGGEGNESKDTVIEMPTVSRKRERRSLRTYAPCIKEREEKDSTARTHHLCHVNATGSYQFARNSQMTPMKL